MIEGAFDARWRALRGVIFAVVLALGLVPIPFALPLLPVDRFIFYQQSLHMTPSTEEHLQVGLLPQHYADMFGWEEMVREVAAAYEMLSPEERKHVVVFGQNYGEAGAIDVLGKKYGPPRARQRALVREGDPRRLDPVALRDALRARHRRVDRSQTHDAARRGLAPAPHVHLTGARSGAIRPREDRAARALDR